MINLLIKDFTMAMAFAVAVVKLQLRLDEAERRLKERDSE